MPQVGFTPLRSCTSLRSVAFAHVVRSAEELQNCLRNLCVQTVAEEQRKRTPLVSLFRWRGGGGGLRHLELTLCVGSQVGLTTTFFFRSTAASPLGV